MPHLVLLLEQNENKRFSQNVKSFVYFSLISMVQWLLSRSLLFSPVFSLVFSPVLACCPSAVAAFHSFPFIPIPLRLTLQRLWSLACQRSPNSLSRLSQPLSLPVLLTGRQCSRQQIQIQIQFCPTYGLLSCLLSALMSRQRQPYCLGKPASRQFKSFPPFA